MFPRVFCQGRFRKGRSAGPSQNSVPHRVRQPSSGRVLLHALGTLRNLGGCPTGQRPIVSVCRVTSRASVPLLRLFRVISRHTLRHPCESWSLTRKCSVTLVAQPQIDQPSLPGLREELQGMFMHSDAVLRGRR